MKKKNIVVIAMILILVILGCVYFSIQKAKLKKRDYEITKISQYNYFVVKEEDKYGVIDRSGQNIIEIKYDDVKIVNPEKPVFICYENNSTKVLNDKKEEIFSNYEEIEPLRLKNISGDMVYEKQTLKYKKEDKYGIIDLSGRKITNAIYDEIDTLEFKEGELLVKKDNKYGVININGITLVKNIYDKIESDKFYENENQYKNSGYIVTKTTEEGYRKGYVNLEGKEIVSTIYNDLYRITALNSDNIYIICAQNGKYGIIKDGKKIIPNEYQSIIYNEDNNLVTVLKGKKYGVMTLEGKTIIPVEYKQIDITGKYIYATNTEEKIKVFNISGQEVDIDSNLAILDVEGTQYKIHIETNEEKTIYTLYKNEDKITKEEYTYIQYLQDNYFIACNTNGQLGIIDEKENNKLEFKYNSIQKIDNTQMIQAINKENITEIYTRDIQKICELSDAKIKSKQEYIIIYNDEQAKYISKEEKEVENKDIFSNNELYAKKSGTKWGFVDSNGNKVIDYKYEQVTEINEYGFAGIKQNGKWGVINSKAEIILEPTYVINDNEPIFIGEYYKVVYGNGEIYYTK